MIKPLQACIYIFNVGRHVTQIISFMIVVCLFSAFHREGETYGFLMGERLTVETLSLWIDRQYCLVNH